MMPLPTTYLRCAFLLSQTTIDKGLVLISSAVGAEDRGGVRSDGRQAAVKVSTSQGKSTLNIARFGFCAVFAKIVLCCLV